MELSVNSIVKRKDARDGGLIGGFFRFAAGGDVYGISCNHVIANINQCSVGDVITDVNNKPVGILENWLLLDNTKYNRAEFALFKVNAGFNPVWTLKDGSFKPNGFAMPALNSVVDFICSDGIKHGIVSDIRHSVIIPLNSLDYEFINCIQVDAMPGEQFSKPGHSGGAVYIGDSLLGIILGISEDSTKTYLVPFINGILSFVNLRIN